MFPMAVSRNLSVIFLCSLPICIDFSSHSLFFSFPPLYHLHPIISFSCVAHFPDFSLTLKIQG